MILWFQFNFCYQRKLKLSIWNFFIDTCIHATYLILGWWNWKFGCTFSFGHAMEFMHTTLATKIESMHTTLTTNLILFSRSLVYRNLLLKRASEIKSCDGWRCYNFCVNRQKEFCGKYSFMFYFMLGMHVPIL